MNLKLKNNALKGLIGFVVFFVFCFYGHGRWVHNTSSSVYIPGDGTQSENSKYNSIETYVINGAGYFLDAQTGIARFSKLTELSGEDVDSVEWLPVLEAALDNITRAKDTYAALINIAEKTPYNQAVLFELASFDYRAFREEYKLNEVVFAEAAAYLKRGDITGIYKRTYRSMSAIEELLKGIIDRVSKQQMPENLPVWRLHEEVSLTLIFGQYVARVFAEINGK